MSAEWRVRLAEVYAQTLSLAIEALHDGPDVLGVQVREDISPGMRTLHVARHGKKRPPFCGVQASTRANH